MHVIFDIDDTLYSFIEPDRLAANAMAAYCREHFGWEENFSIYEIGKSYADVANRIGWNNPSIHNRLVRFKHMLETNHQQVYPHLWNLYNIYWDTILEHIEKEPGLADFIERLKAGGATLGACSNMCTGIQHRKLEALGLQSTFSHVVISEEIGTEKPNKEIFEWCMKQEGVRAEECVMIGDNFGCDCLGALRAGMRACWYYTAKKQGKKPLEQAIEEVMQDPFVAECVANGRLHFFSHYDELSPEGI